MGNLKVREFIPAAARKGNPMIDFVFVWKQFYRLTT